MVLYARISWNRFVETHSNLTLALYTNTLVQATSKAWFRSLNLKAILLLQRSKGINWPSSLISYLDGLIEGERSFVGVSAIGNCKHSYLSGIVTKKNASIWCRDVLVFYSDNHVTVTIAHRFKQINVFSECYV